MREYAKKIRKLILIGASINISLSLIKIIAGIYGKSSAMVADGLHSLSDLTTDLVLILFMRISVKDRDRNHQYGHGKFETFAVMLIGFILFIAGGGIFFNGINKLIDSARGVLIHQPSIITLYIALISIIAKEFLFQFTNKKGKYLGSKALIANAWHHRSDAFSSVGVALGISGAIFLGEEWRILDPLASILVSFFIINTAYKISKESMGELLETSLPRETENTLIAIIERTEGVIGYHSLKTRKIGIVIAVDVHIEVRKDLTVQLSHDIASKIEASIREQFGRDSHIGIHIEPSM